MLFMCYFSVTSRFQAGATMVIIPPRAFPLPSHPQVWAWQDDAGEWHMAWEKCPRYPEGRVVPQLKHGTSWFYAVGGKDRYYTAKRLATLRNSLMKEHIKLRYLTLLTEAGELRYRKEKEEYERDEAERMRIEEQQERIRNRK